MARGGKGKLTPELIKKAIDLLRAGNYKNTVCCLLGVPRRTWYSWEEKGRAIAEEGAPKRGLYLDFFLAVQNSEAVAEGMAVSGILQAGKNGCWQAYAWFLERKSPQRWGRKTEISGPNGTPLTPPSIQVVFSDVVDDDEAN